jgi:aminoglycoside phosphotransferase (APT) family kinase protein
MLSGSSLNVAEALLLLDRLLVEKNKQAVLYFNEFQEVGQITKGRGGNGMEQKSNNLDITDSLVSQLITEQFPKWAEFKITPVKFGGHDNRTFRLGDNLLIRLPSAQSYVAQVAKEQEWLPKLAPHLTMKIPSPVAMGRPNNIYPWPWSIYQWIEGDSANTVELNDVHLKQLATDLADFLKAIQKIDSQAGPAGGEHNYYRGVSLSIYDESTKESLSQLGDVIDTQQAMRVWEEALNSQWERPPVWVHGDIASGNLLINNNKLTAVIDFGCLGVGDPACDLVIAWTLFDRDSRELFKKRIALDAATWKRARGWALWKAAFELAALEDKSSQQAHQQLTIVKTVLQEHKRKENAK